MEVVKNLDIAGNEVPEKTPEQPSKEVLTKELHSKIREDIKNGAKKVRDVIKGLQGEVKELKGMDPDFLFQIYENFEDVYKSLQVLVAHKLITKKLAFLWCNKYLKQMKEEHYPKWIREQKPKWEVFKKETLKMEEENKEDV